VARGLAPAPAIYHDGDASADLDALLARADITVVVVVLPITLQPSIILKALAAGKHVLSEKPVAPDVAGGIGLIATYDEKYKKNLVWRVAENFEAEPGFRAAGEAIKAGKIGKVTFFKAVVTNYVDVDNKYYKTPWRTVPDVRLPAFNLLLVTDDFMRSIKAAFWYARFAAHRCWLLNNFFSSSTEVLYVSAHLWHLFRNLTPTFSTQSALCGQCSLNL
jgi:hypothetical protein